MCNQCVRFMRVIDRVGHVYGRLTVIDRADNTANGQARWLCKCECGNTRVVLGTLLRLGKTKSCGCLQSDLTTLRSTKHGHSPMYGKITPTYYTWCGMKARCTNPKNSHYATYGGKGITFCDKWNTFAGFLEDMGEKPVGKSLDRIDSNGNYCKENCRWATATEQARNKSNNRVIEFNGESKTLAEWASMLGLNQSSLSERLARHDVETALTMRKGGKTLALRYLE